jgi:hypothetical protein
VQYLFLIQKTISYRTLCQRARPPGYFNYDKIFEFTRLWVILIMDRKNYRKAFGTSPKGAGKTKVFSGKVFFREIIFKCKEININFNIIFETQLVSLVNYLWIKIFFYFFLLSLVRAI